MILDRLTQSKKDEVKAMTKHYILSINPEAEYSWNRCILSHPLTAHRPELAQVIAEAVGEAEGTYLIAVNIEVQVLEKVTEDFEEIKAEELLPSQPIVRELPQERQDRSNIAA